MRQCLGSATGRDVLAVPDYSRGLYLPFWWTLLTSTLTVKRHNCCRISGQLLSRSYTHCQWTKVDISCTDGLVVLVCCSAPFLGGVWNRWFSQEFRYRCNVIHWAMHFFPHNQRSKPTNVMLPGRHNGPRGGCKLSALKIKLISRTWQSGS